MTPNLIILAEEVVAAEFIQFLRHSGIESKIDIVDDLDELDHVTSALEGLSILISFGTGIIVPEEILNRLSGRAFNFHAGPPEYPGRDPHHFASYDGVRQYGATAHVMTPKVDDGPILAVEYFEIEAYLRPKEILALANAAVSRLLRKLVPRILRSEPFTNLDIRWSKLKGTRARFYEMCSVSSYVDEDELYKRLKATEFSDFRNLYIDLHGLRFRIEGPSPKNQVDWSEFTESSYEDLIDLALSRFKFANFTDLADGAHVLWRHDVDFSVHRALRLAEIEKNRGAVTTFFFMLNSAFYDLSETEVLVRARKISNMGHHVGLHFDPNRYKISDWTPSLLNELIAAERAQLSELIEAPVDVVSFHNPDATSLTVPRDAKIAGMVNVYSSFLQERYGYCSDSNGYWRFRSIRDVLVSGEFARLQILTHPAWWTPKPLSPRSRIERCVMGRAASIMRKYDSGFDGVNRRNIR